MEVALQAQVSGSWRSTNLSEAQAGSLKFRLIHGNRASSTISTSLVFSIFVVGANVLRVLIFYFFGCYDLWFE